MSINNLLGTVSVFAASAVATTGILTSDIYKIDEDTGGYFSAWVKASSSGTPDLKITYEMSYDTTLANFVTPIGSIDIIASLTVKTAQIAPFSPPYMPYIRFKITGNASNPSDTTVTMNICGKKA